MTWTEGNIEGVDRREPVRFADARGWLTELFRADEIPADLHPLMAYVSATHPGMARGPHEHREQTDWFAFLGPGRFRICLWDPRPGSPSHGRRMVFEAGSHCPLILKVPPGVVHGYTNISKEDGLVLNFPNRLYAGPHRASPVDEIRYEGKANSEFTLPPA